MKRTPDFTVKVIIALTLALAAIGINYFALTRVRPVSPVLSSAPVTGEAHPPQPAESAGTLIPFITPTSANSPTPEVTHTLTPTGFPPTSLSMVPPLKMTELHIFAATARKVTQIADLTAFVKATDFAITAVFQKTRLASKPCPCVADTLDCSDFYTLTEAQICYNHCIKEGAGDIHRLDWNGDGFACRVKK